MDSYIKILTDDLEKGYSKSDLEKLIGLPKNNLSGILKGDRKLSKKSKLKIEKWEASKKPSPLELGLVKAQVKENNNPENKERIEEETEGVKNDISKSVRQNLITPKEASTEPKENTMAFYLKYDCYTWQQVEEKKT